MIYQRSQDIERRLDEVLRLIRRGRYSTPVLANKIGVSTPTISRCISALRRRGHRIRSIKEGSGWRYLLERGQRQPAAPNSGAADSQRFATMNP